MGRILKVTPKRDSKNIQKNVHIVKNVCWICDGWRECQFIFKSQVDSWIHFHFDNFKGRFLGLSSKGQIRYLTMIPKG